MRAYAAIEGDARVRVMGVAREARCCDGVLAVARRGDEVGRVALGRCARRKPLDERGAGQNASSAAAAAAARGGPWRRWLRAVDARRRRRAARRRRGRRAHALAEAEARRCPRRERARREGDAGLLAAVRELGGAAHEALARVDERRDVVGAAEQRVLDFASRRIR